MAELNPDESERNATQVRQAWDADWDIKMARWMGEYERVRGPSERFWVGVLWFLALAGSGIALAVVWLLE